jgi:tetratricopeptide (TPR) repeat protein
MHRKVLELRPAPHPDRSVTLNNLGIALYTRSLFGTNANDLTDAVKWQQDALKLPTNHSNRLASLNNLAVALEAHSLALSHQSGTKRDEEMDQKIICLYDQAASLLGGHPDHPIVLSNLAFFLMSRCNSISDINEAINLQSQVLTLLPNDHPDRSKPLFGLAEALHARYRHGQNHELPDLIAAVENCETSISALSQDHPNKCGVLMKLGDILMDQYHHTNEEDVLYRAMTTFRRAVAVNTAAPSKRFQAAKHWAKFADDAKDDTALEAYRTAIERLSYWAMLAPDMQSRQRVVTHSGGGLARDAAACAIRLGRLDKAVEFLEQGRMIFWSHEPLDRVDQETRQKFQNIALQFERLGGSLHDISRHISDIPPKVAPDYHRLSKAYNSVLEDIRNCPGLENYFLKSISIAHIQERLVNEPVIILNAGESLCAGLIVTSTNVEYVHFPEFTHQTAEVLAEMMRMARSTHSERTKHPFWKDVPKALCELDKRMTQEYAVPSLLNQHAESDAEANIHVGPDVILRFVLGVLWRLVVEPVIRCLDWKVSFDHHQMPSHSYVCHQRSQSPKRLWWCPTGLFTFLPIHAAGHYYGARDDDAIHNYAISSYTPSITSMPFPACLSSPFKFVLVAQPKSEDTRQFLNVEVEVQAIERRLGKNASGRLIKFGSHGPPASPDDVVAELPTASVVHFTCHGNQDDANPLDSCLFLESPLTISRIMGTRMPRASLAFLNACKTAMGDEIVPDEAINLAVAFWYTGFSSVIGTMW